MTNGFHMYSQAQQKNNNAGS
ncbi:hypothetical protein CNEO2_360060 [Clostridium neonatale]|nr:hypothetical protein CNEO2_360060 [Clostridium neonatale]